MLRVEDGPVPLLVSHAPEREPFQGPTSTGLGGGILGAVNHIFV